MNATTHSFQNVCRQWRQYRKLSQLELALAADVSQRHVSWLETGRSQPSRDMVIRLAEAMHVPLRERNVLLQAAGFAAAYRETSLDEPAMAPVRQALERMLDHHNPLPAMVVDRLWQVHLQNNAASALMRLMGDPTEMTSEFGGGGINLALLTVHPAGLRKHITNWEQAAPAFVRRLKSEAIASGDREMQAQLEQLVELAGPVGEGSALTDQLLPVLPLELSISGLQLSLFSVMSTFGTPQDITTDELRIEAFYPGDEATSRFFEKSGQA